MDVKRTRVMAPMLDAWLHVEAKNVPCGCLIMFHRGLNSQNILHAAGPLPRLDAPGVESK
jgi:hypothetical protein